MARPNWADLPVELLLEFIRRVPCQADRQAVRNVCHNWRNALMHSQPPPAPLPWLLLTSGPAPTLSCVLSKGAEHKLVAQRTPPPARYFGSYEGAWVFAALNQTSGHVTRNLRTGATIDLPNVLRLDGNTGPVDIVILAATLSSPPHLPGCIAAGLVANRTSTSSRREITFWRMGEAEAVGRFDLYSKSETSMMYPFRLDVQDLLFHDGAFYFLTEHEECRVCRPNFLDDGTVQAQFQAIYPRDHLCSYVPGCKVISRYLVESRGSLLMVLRCAPLDEDGTSDFVVYKMVQVGTGFKGRLEHDWERLPHLDGRIMFVGRGCSRSYEVSSYPGIEECVYFLDDYNFASNECMFMDDDSRKYDCWDNGKWSGTIALIEHPSLPSYEVSSYSSPTCLLP